MERAFRINLLAAAEDRYRGLGAGAGPAAPPAAPQDGYGAQAACLAGAGIALAAAACAAAGSGAQLSSAPAAGPAGAVTGPSAHAGAEPGVASSPPPMPHAQPRPFRSRVPRCGCDHGGQPCSRTVRPGVDISGGAWMRCADCCFRPVEIMDASNIVCICGCHCACTGCSTAGRGHHSSGSPGGSTSSGEEVAASSAGPEIIDGEAYLWNPADMTFYRAAVDAGAQLAGPAAPGAARCACTRRPTGGTGTTGAGSGCDAFAPPRAAAGWHCAPCGGPGGRGAALCCGCRCSGCSPA
jgi:hypothetical protein